MALQFSAITDRVVYASQGNFTTGAKSILLDYFHSVDGQDNNYFMGFNVSPGSTLVNALFQIGSLNPPSTDRIRFAMFGSPSAQAYTAANTIVHNQWQTIGVTWDGGNTHATSSVAYRNGVSVPWAFTDPAGNFGSTTGEWVIGNRFNGDRGIGGRIGRIVVLNKVATAQEIADFELGKNVREIWPDADLLLAPDTVQGGTWDSTINAVTASASIVGATQVADRPFPNRLDAQLGSYVYTGQDADLGVVSSTGLIAETGSYTYTGQDAILGVPVTIEGLFEGGTVNVAASSVGGTSSDPVVTLVNFLNQQSTWRTMMGRINNVLTTQVSSLQVVVDSSNLEIPFINGQPFFWRPVSGNYDSWQPFDSVVVNGSGVLTATHNSGFAEDIYVSNQPAVLPSDIAAFYAAQIAASPHVSSRVVADPTGGQFATLPATTGFDSFVIPSLGQHAIRITNNNNRPKLRVWMNVENHAHEHIGQQAHLGAILFLLSGDTVANTLLEDFEFECVQINPQGVYGGNQDTGSWQSGRPYQNTNRSWGLNQLTCIQNAETYYQNTAGSNNVVISLDFHNLLGGTSGQTSALFFVNTRPNTTNFFNAMDAAYTGVAIREFAGSTDGTIFANWTYDNFNIPGITMEQDQRTNPTVADYRLWGEASMRALATMNANGDFGALLDAQTGSYTYTGQDATIGLVVPETLNAETGSYVYTGFEADLTVGGGNVLTAETGIYTYTGFDANIGIPVGGIPLWPASLPNEPLRQGYEEGFRELAFRTEMDIGPPKRRKRYRSAPKRFVPALFMTEVQVDIFRNFFNTSLRQGEFSFQFPHPRNGETMLVAFTDVPPPPVATGADGFIVTLPLEILP